MIDWGFAIRIAAGGFGMVFFLLVLLSIIVWGTGVTATRQRQGEASGMTHPAPGALHNAVLEDNTCSAY
jgi:Na+-transporting methylmalonyl-CoA/oxaloacetate decarboxylase gamma subunit